MKMTIDLPEELIRAIKIRAAYEQRTVREVVAAYLTDGLYPPQVKQTDPAAAGAVEIAPWGLPIVRGTIAAPVVPQTPAEAVTLINETLQKLDEERLTRAV
jgi:plasmid stability protein